MGRRSRKRGASAGGSTRAERDAARRKRAEAVAKSDKRGDAGTPRRPGTRERPPAPWGSFPLTELVVLLGLVLAIAGFAVGVEAGRGRTMFGAGLVLGALGGLELAIRDHFAGYRSHSTLLAGLAGFVVVTAVVLAVGEIAPSASPPAVFAGALLAGAIAFAIAFRQLRRVFRDRSGGLSFR